MIESPGLLDGWGDYYTTAQGNPMEPGLDAQEQAQRMVELRNWAWNPKAAEADAQCHNVTHLYTEDSE